MNPLAQFSASQFNSGLLYACPEIFLGLAACAILMLDLLLNDAQRRWTGVLAVISLGITAVLVCVQPLPVKIVPLGGLFELVWLALVLKSLTLLAGDSVMISSPHYIKTRSVLIVS